MSTVAAARAEKAGAALARRRLAGYARYAELLAEQERALDEGALERFEQLAAEALALQREVGAGIAEALPAAAPEHSAGYVIEAREILATAMERSQRVHARLAALRGATAGQIRHLATTRPQARTYLAGPGAGGEAQSTRVNVKF